MIPVASTMFSLLGGMFLIQDSGKRKVRYSAGRIGALVIAFGIPAGLQDSGE